MRVGERTYDCGGAMTVSEVASMLPEIEMDRQEALYFYHAVQDRDIQLSSEGDVLVATVPLPIRVVIREDRS